MELLAASAARHGALPALRGELAQQLVADCLTVVHATGSEEAEPGARVSLLRTACALAPRLEGGYIG